MSSVIDGIRQAQCLAVAVQAASCSRSGGRQWGNSGRQNSYGSSGQCMCPRQPNADSGETCQRKPRCNRKQGKIASSRAATYKLARLAYSRHDAEPAANGGEMIYFFMFSL